VYNQYKYSGYTDYAALILRNGQASAAAGLTRPILGPLWAAGLSFMKCHAERNVPNDPLETGIFMGEEYARAARLYTNG
jgi:hypothetical protein